MSTLPIEAVKHEPRLPSDEDIRALTALYADATDRLQEHVFGIQAVTDPYEDGPGAPLTPTFEDIGRLWDWIDGLELEQWAIGREVERLREKLATLNEIRREATVRREREGA